MCSETRTKDAYAPCPGQHLPSSLTHRLMWVHRSGAEPAGAGLAAVSSFALSRAGKVLHCGQRPAGGLRSH